MTTHCKKPDRDEPKIECGYPLPCPWHTVVVDTTRDPVTVTAPRPISTKLHRRLADVGTALKDKP